MGLVKAYQGEGKWVQRGADFQRASPADIHPSIKGNSIQSKESNLLRLPTSYFNFLKSTDVFAIFLSKQSLLRKYSHESRLNTHTNPHPPALRSVLLVLASKFPPLSAPFLHHYNHQGNCPNIFFLHLGASSPVINM